MLYKESIWVHCVCPCILIECCAQILSECIAKRDDDWPSTEPRGTMQDMAHSIKDRHIVRQVNTNRGRALDMCKRHLTIQSIDKYSGMLTSAAKKPTISVKETYISCSKMTYNKDDNHPTSRLDMSRIWSIQQLPQQPCRCNTFIFGPVTCVCRAHSGLVSVQLLAFAKEPWGSIITSNTL